MNNRNIFISIFLILLIGWGIFILNNRLANKNPIVTDDINKTLTWELKNNIEANINKGKTKKTIKDFKKIIRSRWLVIKWDINLKNDDYLFALQKYTKANKETPNNPKVISKIAETYFLMKNYKSSYNYNLKIKESEEIDKNEFALSYLNSSWIENIKLERNWSWTLIWNSKKEIEKIKENIKTLNLDSENEFYYSNSVECIIDFHTCKLNFENHFKNTHYSWKNENLENVRTAIDNYKNSKSEELYYKNTLIISSLFQNNNFPISIILSNDLLKEKEKYKPIFKILAQSYFELNDIDKANEYLIEYAKIDSKSPDIYYMLWIIAQKKHDNTKSNIYLNIAIEQNYDDLENIYRLQLYNYLILDQNKKISETFDKIIELNENPNFNDLLLATYYNIINNNYNKALIMTNKWIQLYPEKEDFYWFKAWINIENWELDEAFQLLNKAKEINNKNALVILNLWRISKIKYEKDFKPFDKIKAKFLFKKTIELDTAEIWELAKNYLKELEEVKKEDIKEENKK